MAPDSEATRPVRRAVEADLVEAPQAEVVLTHQQLLRQARNARYYEKKREKTRTRDSESDITTKKPLTSQTEEQKTLRKARNARYYARRKSRTGNATPDADTTVPAEHVVPYDHITFVSRTLRRSQTISNNRQGLTLLMERTAQRLACVRPYPDWGYTLLCYDRLRSRLKAWGLPADLQHFGEDLELEWEKVREDSNACDEWISEKEQWVRGGDAILEIISAILGDEEVMEQMTPEGMGDVWAELSGIAYQVMYMMSTLEARLVLLQHY